MSLVHVTAVPEATRGLIHLDVASSGLPAGGVTLFRRLVGGTTLDRVIVPAAWAELDGTIRLLNAQAAFDDTCAPLDLAVEYLATWAGQATPTVVSGSAILANPGGWWLGCPMRPYLNLVLSMRTALVPCSGSRAIFILKFGDEERAARSTLTDQSQRADRIHTSYPMGMVTSNLELATKELADADALAALLDPGDVLLLRAPGNGGYGFVNRFCSITGSGSARLVADGRRAWRRTSLEYELVLAPAGGAYGTSGVTWDGLCGGAYATLAAATAAGTSWRSIADGIVGGTYPTVFRTWSEVSSTWATWAALTATGKTWLQVTDGS